jgi:hypothetical protein
MTKKSAKQLDMSDIEADLMLEVNQTSTSRGGLTHLPSDEDRARFRDMELILEIGGEGGGITLYGANTSTGWEFCLAVVDQSLLLAGEDKAIQHMSGIAKSWGDALALLDRYPWPELYPLFVHSVFRDNVIEAVVERVNRRDFGDLQNWQHACGVSANGKSSDRTG